MKLNNAQDIVSRFYTILKVKPKQKVQFVGRKQWVKNSVKKGPKNV